VQTDFTAEQLADPDIAASEKILRTCTHCGFCTATCPTYVLLGDELDSPRGRIYLMKEMLAGKSVITPDTVKHIDRCLSCLACMTTCPSGVNYMHLVDHARRWIEDHFRRPWGERGLRAMLGAVLSCPVLFRAVLRCAALAKPLARILPRRLWPLLALAPDTVPPRSATPRAGVFPAEGARRMRVGLLTGCAQRVLAPEINEATIRLLTRHGCEVVVPRGGGCCGALVHHLGKGRAALGLARANMDQLRGGDTADNSRIIQAVLHAERRDEARSIVIANAAAALFVGGHAATLREAAAVAAESIDSGAAQHKLEELAKATTDGAGD